MTDNKTAPPSETCHNPHKISSETYIRHKMRLSDYLHLGSLFGDD